MAFQEVMRDRFTAVIEHATGRIPAHWAGRAHCSGER
jgi:hypothetical protein